MLCDAAVAKRVHLTLRRAVGAELLAEAFGQSLAPRLPRAGASGAAAAAAALKALRAALEGCGALHVGDEIDFEWDKTALAVTLPRRRDVVRIESAALAAALFDCYVGKEAVDAAAAARAIAALDAMAAAPGHRGSRL